MRGHADGSTRQFVTVTVSNGQADPRSAAQLLNGVSFALSSGQASGTLGLDSANIRKVQKGGSFVDFGPPTTGWALASDVAGATVSTTFFVGTQEGVSAPGTCGPGTF